MRAWRAAAALAFALAGGAAQAGALRYCDTPTELTHEQRDRLFRFAEVVRSELQASGQRIALVSRAGIDLSRFGERYSHAGLTLQGNAMAPWSVRQLYYACEDREPKLFDQGMLAFVLGMNEPQLGYVSIVLLPPEDGAEIERRALDNRHALQLLGSRYSANAYPFNPRYQNCNQWVAELLASARGTLDDGDGLRERAQGWLKAQGFQPTVFDGGFRPLMWAASHLVPWLHEDDHPREDLSLRRYLVAMPASIEAFVQATVPGAERVELCHDGRRAVLHRGWKPVAEGCVPEEGDTVIPFD